jgi:hypothetical protein
MNTDRNSRRSASSAAQDEAYAQALQEEYRKDFLRRQAKKNKFAQENRERERQQQQVQLVQPQSLGDTNTAALDPASTSMHRASAPPEDLLSSPYVPTAYTTVPPPPLPTSSGASPFVLSRSQTTEDERYARQLQAELEREGTQFSAPSNNDDYRRSSSTNRRANSAANSARSGPSRSNPPRVPSSAEPYVNTPRTEFAYDNDDPSYLDLKLAQELQDEEYARRLQQQQSKAPVSTASMTVPPAPLQRRSPSNFSDERTSSNVSDQAAARRIQQELQDAEYARRLSVMEQEEAMAAAQALQQQETAPRRYGRASLFAAILVGTTIAVVTLLFVTGVFQTSDVPFLGDLFGDDFIGSDPWSGNTTGAGGPWSGNTTEAGDPWSGNTTGAGGPQVGANSYAWANSGNGLTLEILNACSDDWQVFLTEALNNWDNGYPIDSLSFVVTRIDYESECSDVDGKFKVCNGNYGDTRWRGLNEVLLNPRQTTITSSITRLNEYYLAHESDAQRLYTACHELGHGFGLPHWDENFYNAVSDMLERKLVFSRVLHDFTKIQ